jgi:sulfur relay (sulfurtransferase) DsrC/TusE family protein
VLAPKSRTRDFVEWTPDRADVVARRLGIVLGPDQWRVIACARELEATAPGHVRLDDLTSRLGKELREIRALFPEPLLDTLIALAGLTR